MAAFFYNPHAMFIGEYGLPAFEESMAAMYDLTKVFTAEFCIRPFIAQYPSTHGPLAAVGQRPRRTRAPTGQRRHPAAVAVGQHSYLPFATIQSRSSTCWNFSRTTLLSTCSARSATTSTTSPRTTRERALRGRRRVVSGPRGTCPAWPAHLDQGWRSRGPGPAGLRRHPGDGERRTAQHSDHRATRFASQSICTGTVRSWLISSSIS